MEIGLPSHVFKSDYFEKNIFYAKNIFNSLNYNWSDFSDDFYAVDPAFATVRLYKNGKIPREKFQHATQQREEIIHHFDAKVINDILKNGGSLIVNRFDRNSAFVNRICKAMSNICGYVTVGNAYVSNGGTGTFGLHYDSHCVFAVQLIGAKRWKVYRPTKILPLSDTQFKDVAPPADADLVFDKIIEQGDVLYVPRGWWHSVEPINGQPSLHIAVGVHTPKIYDYLRWVLTHKMGEQQDFRETMNINGDNVSRIANACHLLEIESSSQESFEGYIRAAEASVAAKSFVGFDSIFNQGN